MPPQARHERHRGRSVWLKHNDNGHEAHTQQLLTPVDLGGVT